MGNYKSLSSQELATSSNTPPSLIFANSDYEANIEFSNKKLHLITLNNKKLNLVRHLRILHGSADQSSKKSKRRYNNKLVKHKEKLKTDPEKDTQFLPQIVLVTNSNQNSSSETDYTTINEDQSSLNRIRQEENDLGIVENYYESTSEILDPRTLKRTSSNKNQYFKSDNYFNIDEDEDANEKEVETTPNLEDSIDGGKFKTSDTQIYSTANSIYKLRIKSNSVNNLYSEVVLKQHQNNNNNSPLNEHNATTKTFVNVKSATLASRTGIQLSKILNQSSKKCNIQSLSKLIQKLTTSNKNKKLPPPPPPSKSFDPDQEFYFDLNSSCNKYINNKRPPNLPKALPPPRPPRLSSNSFEIESSPDNSLESSIVFNSSNNNNTTIKNDNKSNLEDNYQSMPEYDYIGVVAAPSCGESDLNINDKESKIVVSSDGTPPRPPPCSTQPHRNLLNDSNNNNVRRTSQVYSSIVESFNVNNIVYYSFTSPSGTTLESVNSTTRPTCDESMSNRTSLSDDNADSNGDKNNKSSKENEMTVHGFTTLIQTCNMKNQSVVKI
jgi:hypothetical protein